MINRSSDTLSQVNVSADTLAVIDTLLQKESADTVVAQLKEEVVVTGFEGTPISYNLKSDDGITAVLLLCFFFTSYVLSRGKKYLFQQLKDFTHTKERGSIFAASTAADFRYGLLLLLQTCVLLGICFFDYFHDNNPRLFTSCPTYIILAVYIGICIVYYFLKWLIYSFLSWIFIDKTKATLWIESYLMLLYYFGFSLFPLVLLMVYFDLSANILIPIGLGLVIFIKLLMFYKWFKLFFSHLYGLLGLIVYFCALEIMPCFVLYQALVQINNVLLIKI